VTDISIILLNWNSHPVVLDAARAAMAQRDVTVELIVVDNGSTDGSLMALRAACPGARFIELGRNTGFTGGMNAGTDAAHGEFVLWHNADLVLDEDYCLGAVAACRHHPELGAVGGTVLRLVDGVRTEQLDACGYVLRNSHRVRFVSASAERDVIGVSGSCPVFRRAALDEVRRPVGYVLDPWYFAYGEDIDVMLRLNLSGWRVRYLPALRAWHVRSGSTKAWSRFYEKPDAIQVHHFKNRVATVVKTMPPSALSWRLPVLLGTEALLPFYLAARGRPASIRNWLQAWRLVWSERRRLYGDRRAIERSATAESRRRLAALLREGA